MFKLFFADKDTYITNKIIGGVNKVSSSVGHAGTLDLFKIYDQNSGTIELSRGLIHFDISALKSLYASNLIDINHESFHCKVNLKDVYGGQPTPAEFNLCIHPLSRSFSEGFGKDIVYLLDYDAANYLSSSANNEWFSPGASAHGHVTSSTGVDYFTAASFGQTKSNQFFKTGEEDLSIDVTKIISATLSGEIPDSGFRLSFDSEEQDNLTYFVKRFASRHAYDSTLQPTLTVGFDDSIQDDSARMHFSSTGSLFIYNFDGDEQKNLQYGGTDLTGEDCIKLTLKNQNYLGGVNLSFTGSQFKNGSCAISGVYYANVSIPTTPEISAHLKKSGSISFTPIWSSLDNSVSYITGSAINFYPKTTYTLPENSKKLVVGVTGVPHKLNRSDKAKARVNVFDITDPLINVTKFSVETPGKVFKKSHYRIREIDSNRIIVPFDTAKKSTKLSSDGHGMFFFLDGMSLYPGKNYIVDILIIIGNDEYVYENVSSPFLCV